MKKLFFIAMLLVLPLSFLFGETVNFDGSWGQNPLFNIVSESNSGIELVFSMHQMVIEEKEIDGVTMKSFGVPAVFLSSPGVPNLGGASRYIAIPQGSRANVTVVSSQTEVYHNIEVAPAPNIPRDDDDSPLKYEKDMKIYGNNAYWPLSPLRLSEAKQIRGVDVVIVGVIPFQYNPITKDLVIYKDIRVRIDFVGGNGHFGEDRLRNRLWEPILQGHLLNYASLPKIDFYSPERMGAKAGFEYIIIVPDDALFEAWADTIKAWRKLQGISSEVYTLTEVGGSSSTAIENFLNNAYNTWNPAPVAFLLLSDYPSSGKVYGITSPVWDSYCVSDHIYADVDGDDVADMYHARICAQSGTHLSIMINKFLSYERNPYTSPSFHDEPLVACGWQTERWFQLCSETVRHFMINNFGKSPARQYNIYSGSPTSGCAWSSRQGTAPTVQYWYNAGWLPGLTNPYDSGWWDNGSAAGITAAINSGAFIVQHRDHGGHSGWGEPSYDMNDLDNLTNTMFTFVFSINCLTGEYDYSSEVFAEKFHRIQYGALGVNAASQSSMSFVNDTYVWGYYDGMWSEFDPGYPAVDLPGHRNLRPCEAMTYGKLYHDVMWFPDSAGAGSYRGYTRNLFHHHGDAFITLYSEVPQNLTVSHSAVLLVGQTSFAVTANDSSIIALTVSGEIIGVAEGTGSPVNITIPSQGPGTMKVTVTKANYYRYEADVNIIPPSGPYVGYLKSSINDTGGGNGDGIPNPGESIDWGIWVKNFGNDAANGVFALLSLSDPYVSISVDSSWYGNIAAGDSALGSVPYTFSIANDCPDDYSATFDLNIHDSNDSVWVSYPSVTVHAPVLTLEGVVIDGAGNGHLDPDETADVVVTLKNGGSADAASVTGYLFESSSYITVPDPDGTFGDIVSGGTADNSADPFMVHADAGTPIGENVTFYLEVTSGVYCDTLQFNAVVGRMHYFIWDFDPNTSSGPAIDAALQACGFSGDYNTSLPVATLNDYMAVFVCVGIYSSNNIITDGSPEATALVNFVNGGGRMYLEGGDVWYFDPQYNSGYDFGPLFGINPTDDGSSDLATLQGQSSTFTTGMSFSYSGENSWIDHISPTGSGFLIFENSSPAYDCGVANDAGSYRTVGVSWEFGGLVDGSPPSTKVALADSIMHFFGIFMGVEEEPVNTSSIPKVYGLSQSYPNPSRQSTNIRYQLPRRGEVNLRVYDVSGRLIKVVIDGVKEAGYHSERLDTKGYASGVYFYRLTAGDKTFTRKMLVVR